ncbi:hypothetical protein FRC04_003136 [Tulasnella sp. 424]|nr:hypothetical protein FRC04_003136 [Tulasnella sp. 424]
MDVSFLNFKSFHLYFNSKLPSPAFSSHDEQTLFDHLSDMIKQNYLDRVQVPMPGGAPVQGRARRKSRKRPTKKRKVYTRGGGAHAPMLRSGNRNVAEFICAFMKKSWLEERLKLLGEDKEEEERTTPGLRGKNAARNPNHGAEKEAELEDKAEEYGGGLLKDITRVAGSELTKVLGDPSGTSGIDHLNPTHSRAPSPGHPLRADGRVIISTTDKLQLLNVHVQNVARICKEVTVPIRGSVTRQRKEVINPIERLTEFASKGPPRFRTKWVLKANSAINPRKSHLVEGGKSSVGRPTKLAANLNETKVRAVGEVAGVVALGEPQQDDRSGRTGREILELKTTFNDVVVRLRNFAEEVSRASLEVGGRWATSVDKRTFPTWKEQLTSTRCA